MSEKIYNAEKYHKLSSATAVFLVILMVGYYMVSVFYTGNIVGGLKNIKEHPFPVVIAAGDMKANILQIRLLADWIENDRSEAAHEEVQAAFIQNQESSRQALDVLIQLYLTDANSAKKLSALYDKVVKQQTTLMELCQNPNILETDIKGFVDEMIAPLLDEMDSELSLIDTNTIHKFNEF